MNENIFISILETPYFKLEKTLHNYSGNEPYYRLNSKDSIICCLMDKKDNILLVEQFRPNLGYISIEFPAGEVENDETPVEAAKREIREEIGVTCCLQYLGAYRLLMNRTMNKDHLFIGLTSGVQTELAEHGIKTHAIPRKKLIRLINDNEFEQLAALGIIQLINLKFQINFLKDDKVINKIWS